MNTVHHYSALVNLGNIITLVAINIKPTNETLGMKDAKCYVFIIWWTASVVFRQYRWPRSPSLKWVLGRSWTSSDKDVSGKNQIQFLMLVYLFSRFTKLQLTSPPMDRGSTTEIWRLCVGLSFSSVLENDLYLCKASTKSPRYIPSLFLFWDRVSPKNGLSP